MQRLKYLQDGTDNWKW